MIHDQPLVIVFTRYIGNCKQRLCERGDGIIGNQIPAFFYPFVQIDTHIFRWRLLGFINETRRGETIPPRHGLC